MARVMEKMTKGEAGQNGIRREREHDEVVMAGVGGGGDGGG